MYRSMNDLKFGTKSAYENFKKAFENITKPYCTFTFLGQYALVSSLVILIINMYLSGRAPNK